MAEPLITKEDLLLEVEKASYKSTNIIDVIKTMFRSNNMQEFVEEPSDREYSFIINKSVTELNQINPVTVDLDYNSWVGSQDSFVLLSKMAICNTIEMVLTDYAHKGLESHSIEDLAVGDRTSRYDSLHTLCNKDQIKEETTHYKKARGIGVDVESGKAEGSLGCVRINDFDDIGTAW